LNKKSINKNNKILLVNINKCIVQKCLINMYLNKKNNLTRNNFNMYSIIMVIKY